MKSSYKIAFKCSGFKSNELNGSRCVLGISVGQYNHEGDRFLSTILKLNEKFSHCSIVVADTLQKYTLSMNNPDLTDKEALQLSIDNGNAWVQRNSKFIEILSIDYCIQKWNAVLANERYGNMRRIINFLYQSSIQFRDYVDQSVDRFLRKMLDKLPSTSHFDIKRATTLSRTYLLEESAVFATWLSEYDFFVYPDSIPPAILYIFEHPFNQDDFKKQERMRPVLLKFRKRRNMD